MSARAKATPEKEYPEPVYLVKHGRPKPGPKARIERDQVRDNIVSAALTDVELKAFEIMRKNLRPFVPTRSQYLAHIICDHIDRNRRRDVPGIVPLNKR